MPPNTPIQVTPRVRRARLAAALALACFAATAIAQQAPEIPPAQTPPASDPQHPTDTSDEAHIKALAGVVVTASAAHDTAAALSRPAESLSDARLDESRATSLGDTVASLPGVQSSNFGPAVGRPIIRGLDGPRVAVLENGTSSQDVSTVSQDHAPVIEPFLADRIELLRGPAALLYGSGAIGGAINVIDGRIPELTPVSPLGGRAETRFFTGDQGGNTSMARLDGGSERFALHADAGYRHAPDYDTPQGRQRNSFIDTRAGAVGGSLLGDWGFVGLSAAHFDNAYGNPGEPGDAALGERGVHLRMRQDRIDARGALRDLWGEGNGLRFAFTHTGYGHTEFEGEMPGTIFRKNANDGRVEASFGTAVGWQAVFGLQAAVTQLEAVGEEAFLPATRSRSAAAFFVARRSFDALQFDFGARTERTTLRPDNAVGRSFNPSSLSIAGTWTLDERWALTLDFDRVERAPSEEELFSDGPHIATLAYETGDPQLHSEAANQIELGLRYQSEHVSAKFSAYRNRYIGFIYLADTGNSWYWDEANELLPIRQWTQGNAVFRGLEAEVNVHLASNDSGDWDLRVFGDTVRATLASGGNLPRIAPSRLGAQLRWEIAGWRAALGATRTSRQGHASINETPTAGYTLIDAHLTRHFDTGDLGWELFADAGNLTNQTARVHTSFLKDKVSLPGRSVGFGVRIFF